MDWLIASGSRGTPSSGIFLLRLEKNQQTGQGLGWSRKKSYTFGLPPGPQDASHTWRFIRIPEPKNAMASWWWLASCSGGVRSKIYPPYNQQSKIVPELSPPPEEEAKNKRKIVSFLPLHLFRGQKLAVSFKGSAIAVLEWLLMLFSVHLLARCNLHWSQIIGSFQWVKHPNFSSGCLIHLDDL